MKVGATTGVLFASFLAGTLLAVSSAQAAQAPPDDQIFFFQTNAPDATVGFGDWYSGNASGAGNGFHYLAFYVPCSWPADLDVMVDLFSPEMNANLVNDEIAGVADPTRFELYGPGTSYEAPATPAPPVPSIVQRDYQPQPNPEWRRLWTLDDPVTCGRYLLRAETFPGGDQNSWQLRVYADDDIDPNNAVPANSDNPDGLPGTDDEITIGQLQMTYEERSPEDCATLFQFVQPGLAAIQLNNFDMDGNQRVRYFAPRDAVDPEGLVGGIAGTVSGQTAWNGGTLADRGGADVIVNPESGWWGLVTCVGNNNQFIQEGQEGVPTFFQVPPTPFLAILKNDNTAEAAVGDRIDYTIRLVNTSNQSNNPGAATNIRFVDTLPAATSFVSCAIDGPFTGSCSEFGGVVTYTINEPVLAGEAGTLRLSVTIDSGAAFPLENVVRVDYADSQQVNSFVNTATELTFSSAALSLAKTVVPTSAAVGDLVEYAFTISNPSEVPVQLTDLGDNRLGPIAIPQDRNLPDLLYQFRDDGTGSVVEDVGTEPPAIDLTVEDPANVAYNLPDRLTITSAANPTRLSFSPSDAPALNDICIRNAEFSIEAWVDPANSTQTGIIAAIGDASGSNIELIQDGSEYVFRALTTDSGLAEVRSGVNVAQPGLVQLVGVRSDLGVLRLFVNKAADVFDDVPRIADSIGSLTNWGRNRPLVLANAPDVPSTDPTDAWIGDYVRLGIYCEVITAREISEAFAFGPGQDIGASQVLLPGESTRLIANYELQASDLPGPLVNVAQVEGVAPEGLTAGDRDEASVILTPSSLAVSKTAGLDDGSGNFIDLPARAVLAPGQRIRYEIVVRNDGSARNSSLVVADPLPDGLAYVPESTVVNGFRLDRFEVLDDFSANDYAQPSVAPGPDDWSGPWVEARTSNSSPAATDADFNRTDISIPSTAGGDGDAQDQLLIDSDSNVNEDLDIWITRAVDLSRFASTDLVELRFDYQFFGATEPCGLTRPVAGGTVDGVGNPGNGQNARDCLFIRVSSDDATYTTLDFLGGSATENPLSAIQYVVDLSSVAGGPAWIRFRAEGFRQGEAVALDNVRVVAERYAPVVLDNAPASANPALLAGAPPDLLLAGDELALDPGDALSITFEATVLDPVPPTVSTIRNVAVADSNEAPPALGEITHAIQPRGLIGDKVWIDLDGDGVFDIGEPGLGGVRVDLYTAGGATPIASSRTGVEGDYAFLRLPGDAYEVRIAASEIPAAFAPTAGNPPGGYAFTLADGAANRSADFGYVLAVPTTGALGDTVFSDADGDGLRDPGEPGIAGVSVELIDAAGATIASTITGPDGTYLFSSLQPGKYRVRVTPPGAYTPTTATLTPPLAVAAGAYEGRADFGLRDPSLASVRQRVWFDTNGNGQRDFDEADFSAIQFNLLDAGGSVVASALSDSTGIVRFAGLVPGAYRVELVGASAETNLVGGIARLEPTTAAAEDLAIAVTVNGAVSGEDFGFNQAGFLGDTVFVDGNGNGVQDPGEPGLRNVALTIYEEDGDGNFEPSGPDGDDPIDFATTTADGRYGFQALPFGTFFVEVDGALSNGRLYDDYVLTTADDVPGVNLAQRSATLSAGNGGDVTLDFGFQPTSASVFDVRGTVFEDRDRNGRENGEPGFAAVVMELVDASGLVIASTTTDGSGAYRFSDLPATGLDGTTPVTSYTVRVADAGNVLAGFALTAGLDAQTFAVDGRDVVDLDFGYARASTTASIGDLVWLDADGDGVRDGGEAGVAGVAVALLDAGPDGLCGTADDIRLARTRSNALGGYAFDGLAGGIYCVAFDADSFPVGTIAGGTSPLGPILLTDGEDFNDADFPLVAAAGTAWLGDRVYIDADGDGEEDSGELGLAGVTIDLVSFGPDGNPNTSDDVTDTTTTDERGFYRFSRLAPQTYYVTLDLATVPAGYTPIQPDASNLTYIVDALADRAYTLLDYGLQSGTALGSITQTIFSDSDNDGTRDIGEPGLGFVTVDLIDGSGNVLATVLSDGAGQVRFSGVPPGSYTLAVTDTGGITAGLARTTPAGGPIPVIVTGGANVMAPDVGFGTFSGPRGTIGDLVWHDVDGNGIKTPTESGIENVAVDLWLDTNRDGAIQPGVDNRVRTALTDANGAYQFAGLGLDDYLVTLRTADPMLAGFTAIATGDSRQQPYAAEISVAKLLARYGSAKAIPKALEVATADFGYQAQSQAYALSGTVFDDIDNDGTGDLGELGIPGAAVLLYRDLDGDDVLDPEDGLLGRTTADSDGAYAFANLPPGDYLVVSDVANTAAQDYFQTTQTTTRGIAPVAIQTSDGAADFGYYNGGVTTTPVELAYVAVQPTGAGVTLSWSTASEYGNAAFQWWTAGKDGRMRRIGAPVPSQAVTSASGLDYELTLGPEAVGEQYWIEDIATTGESELRGPFRLGSRWGARFLVEAIDWPSVRAVLAEAAQLRSSRMASRSITTNPVVDLAVRASGLYEVTGADLQAAGASLASFVTADLALTTGGRPVPMHVTCGTTTLAPDCRLLFVGEAEETLYRDERVYRLQVDRSTARRMTVLDGQPSRVDQAATREAIVERAENLRYDYSSPGAEPWYFRQLAAFGTSAATTAVELDLSDAIPGSTPTLEVAAWGVTDFFNSEDHRVTILVNGQPVAERVANGNVPIDVAVPLEPGSWVPGTNTVAVEVRANDGAAFSFVNLDAVRIRHRTAPRLEAGNSLMTLDLARTDLVMTPSGGPEAIFASGFEAAAVRTVRAGFVVEGLVEADELIVVAIDGEEQGLLRGASVRRDGAGWVADIPAGLVGDRAAIATARSLLSPAVRLPAIDATLYDTPVDYLMIAHPGLADALQPLAEWHASRGFAVRVVTTETIYDTVGHGHFGPEALEAYITGLNDRHPLSFVLLAGGDSYDYKGHAGASMSLVPTRYGRVHPVVRYGPADSLLVDLDGDRVPDLPVGRFPARTPAELAAMVAKTIAYAQGAGRSALLAADRDERFAPYSRISDTVADQLLPGYGITRAYLTDLSVADARSAILAAVEGGVSLVHYFGHSAFQLWGLKETLLNANDVRQLTNVDPTVVMQWGCWNSYFTSFGASTIAHAWLTGPAGAAAVLGPSALARVSSEQLLGNLFLSLVTVDGLPLGTALTLAKQELARHHENVEDVVLGYTLLGDPALELR